MKQIHKILSVLILGSLLFVSCESRVEFKNAIVGRWLCDSVAVSILNIDGSVNRTVTKYSTEFLIEFFENGKRAAGGEIEGEWNIDGNILYVSFYDPALNNQEYFIEELNNKNLTIRYKGFFDYPRQVYYYSKMR